MSHEKCMNCGFTLPEHSTDDECIGLSGRLTGTSWKPYPEEEDNRGRDRDEWRHEAAEQQRLK